MDSILPELLMGHILPHLNTKYLSLHMTFVNKHFHFVCTRYLRNKKMSTDQEYFSWLLSFLDTINHIDIDIDEITEEIKIASGNMKHIELSENTCKYAIKYGHLHILQWAKENGCDWDPKICADAAMHEHRLHIVQWINENSNWQ
jgi:hypothetical protein